MATTLIIFFILGLAIGSFLNVAVYRLKTAENIVWERSHCPHCKKIIRWYDNIPLLSFILLKFRCRYCKQKISFQYPLVELFTGILFLFIGWRYFVEGNPASWFLTAYYLGIVSFLITILVYDWLNMEIPGLVLWPAVGWAVVFNLIFNYSGLGNASIFNISVSSALLAMIVAFLFFFLLSAASKEKWMGMGDAYLAILIGLVTGWPQVLLALILSFFIGAVVGIILILAKKKKMKSQIPFAPFLVLGTLIAMFFYGPVVNWYLSLFRF